VTAEGITPAVAEWAERVTPGARVAGCTVRPLAGGSVARWVEQLTLHLSGGHAPLELVRKEAAAHEIAGLSAAQAARADDTAIPELVAYGSDWLITPFAVGVPLDWGDPVPANLFDTLAALHARYHGGAGLPAAIPRVTPAWWRALCLDWGGSRVGPAALDLANLVTADSADVARYAGTWLRLTGQPLAAGPLELGYRWAALQIPVQYLPWGAGHRPTRDVEAALDQIEQAMDRLSG
jgi:hypothetical protein